MTGVDVVEQALVRVVPHHVGKAKEGRRALQGRDHPEQCYRGVTEVGVSLALLGNIRTPAYLEGKVCS